MYNLKKETSLKFRMEDVPFNYNLLAMIKGKTFCQLHKDERLKIEVLLQQGLSISLIARQLGRPASTISREIKRNGPLKYDASKAQDVTSRRHRHKPKRTVFDQSMIDFIDSSMRNKRWSPEIISIEGRKQRPDFISHEWIYRWVWSMKFSQWKTDKKYNLLYKYLKHGSGRKRRGKQRCNRGNILKRQWIENRCPSINKRQRIGDMEADIVLGKDRKPGLLVMLDRKTRKAWLRRLKSRETEYVMKKVRNICQSIGNVKSVTLDNDPSFARHYKLHDLGIDTYFTHPFSSQEKGSVENRIGIIRMFYPKKTDFRTVSVESIKRTEKLINERPMRMFNYKSPNEIHISVPYKTKKSTPLHL